MITAPLLINKRKRNRLNKAIQHYDDQVNSALFHQRKGLALTEPLVKRSLAQVLLDDGFLTLETALRVTADITRYVLIHEEKARYEQEDFDKVYQDLTTKALRELRRL